MITLSLASLFLAGSSLAQFQGFIDNTDLSPYYPYVVHLPTNATSDPPPAVMFLHGTGSRSNPGGPSINELATWNGIGKRLRDYNEGEMTDSARLISEQFLSIMPIAPNETLTEWRGEHIKPIVEQVRSTYGFDDNRLYLCGYSMGARDGWLEVLNDTNYWTALVVAAGEPHDTDLTPLVNFPIRHYQGSTDYVSTFEESLATQKTLTDLGSTTIELVVVENTTHNEMADTPWQADMFLWMLEQTKENRTSPSASASGSVPSAPTLPLTTIGESGQALSVSATAGVLSAAASNQAIVGAAEDDESAASSLSGSKGLLALLTAILLCVW